MGCALFFYRQSILIAILFNSNTIHLNVDKGALVIQVGFFVLINFYA